MSCECKICQRHKEFIKHLVHIDNADAVVFFQGIYEDLTHAELDRDVSQAIVNGTWPSSEEILSGFRDNDLGHGPWKRYG